MTRKEREEALYALRKSTPIMAMTPNEFDDYIKTLNKIADWLEQEPCEDCQRIYKPNPYYDCISRQNAIDAIWLDLDEDTAHKVRDILEVQPSVVLKQEPCEDVISRDEVFKQINCWIGSGEYRYTNATDYLRKRVSEISSVQPKLSENEDCISRQAVLDCAVIEGSMTWIPVDSVKVLPPVTPQPKTGWIPLKTRPMTEEETEHYFEFMDMRIDDTYTILDCPLPDDGQEVLVSWGGMVCVDTFFKEYDGCYFEGVEIDDVDAWQPLPKPYKAESEVQE